MPLGLRREGADQEGHGYAAQHGNQDHRRAPEGRRREPVRVVAKRDMPREEEIVHQADQVAEQDRAHAGDDAKRHGQQRQPQETQSFAVLAFQKAAGQGRFRRVGGSGGRGRHAGSIKF
ncbi:hypothetical protein GALL_538250 [mine drainage metagenome]|uniref:Uncharacterized protein n=1 Tax=mine drainage metagenome TaxID=410659 RepID=A0A1J5P1Y8_9ZZZZ